MAKLASVIKGKRSQPPRILIYGGEGIGKTTWASQAPNPIFIETEEGSDSLDVARFPLAKSFRDVTESIRELRDTEHDFKTVVIDSADWLERFIHEWILQTDGAENMAKACGGYGGGFQVAVSHWRTVLQNLDQLRAKGMAIIFVAHSAVVPVKDPEQPQYDQNRPRLHKDSAALLTEWADVVGFASRKIAGKVVKDEDGGEKFIPLNAGSNGAERVLRLVGSPTWVAKNRFNLPAEIPLQWGKFCESFAPATA
jgi:hypothetical protein